MAEIKPLAHWRRLDEVVVVAGHGTFEPVVTITGGGNTSASGQYVRIPCPSYEAFKEEQSGVGYSTLPPWPTPEELAEVWRGLAEKVRQSAVPARHPFPARALRDRPWDISALVE